MTPWTPINRAGDGDADSGQAAAAEGCLAEVSFVTGEGTARSIQLEVKENMKLTPQSLRALVATEIGIDATQIGQQQKVLEALVLRQLGQEDLKLAPHAPLQLTGNDKFVLCNMLAPCARYDLCVKVKLPNRMVEMDLHSHLTIAGVCREVQSREGILAGRLRLHLEPPGASPSSGTGASLSPGIHLCEVCLHDHPPSNPLHDDSSDPSSEEPDENACIFLHGEELHGHPPLVDLDFFWPAR